jgi:hypothetical protein
MKSYMLLLFILYVILVFPKIIYTIPCIYLVHLAIINTAFYQPKKVGPNGVWVLSLFSTIALDLQRSLFVITMTKNVKLAMHKTFWCQPNNQVVENLYFLADSWSQNLKVHKAKTGQGLIPPT